MPPFLSKPGAEQIGIWGPWVAETLEMLVPDSIEASPVARKAGEKSIIIDRTCRNTRNSLILYLYEIEKTAGDNRSLKTQRKSDIQVLILASTRRTFRFSGGGVMHEKLMFPGFTNYYRAVTNTILKF